MKRTKIEISNPGYSIVLTSEQFEQLGIDTSQDEIRLDVKTFGCWQIPVSVTGLCVECFWEKKPEDYRPHVAKIIIHGQRTMSKVSQGGYELDGIVSVDGVKRRCYTSSMIFETETGHLINVGTINLVKQSEE